MSVHIIDILSSWSPRVMGLVRAFTLLCLRSNSLFWTWHVPGISNGVIDALETWRDSISWRQKPIPSQYECCQTLADWRVKANKAIGSALTLSTQKAGLGRYQHRMECTLL